MFVHSHTDICPRHTRQPNHILAPFVCVLGLLVRKCASAELETELARGDWGFDGYITGDW